MRSRSILFWGITGLLAAGLVIYSQTNAFAWDEGFHLLAAQLIRAGRKPYLDFCFSQTPLNAYWNAGWMSVFGESWRTAHAVAALAAAGAVWLTADFVFRRFPIGGWRMASALLAASVFALNSLVVEFGPVGQAYGFCLLLIVSAFCVTIRAVDESGWRWSGLAGLLAGAAAASSLLTAPVAPVLLAWLSIHNRKGQRPVKSTAFIAGVGTALLPVLWLFVQSPGQVFFGIIQYNFLYRQVDWPGATQHNLEVLSAWVDSPQAILLTLLAIAGLVLMRRNAEHQSWRAELTLCGCLALVLTVYIATPRPTFERYFLFAVPFLAILASAGLYETARRLDPRGGPRWPVLAVTLLLALGLAKKLYDRRDYLFWRDMEAVARKVEQVTPPHATLLADEMVYFLTRRRPPPGMEMDDSHKFDFPPAIAAFRHVVSKADLDRMVKAGTFSTVETCDSDDEVEARKLRELYGQKAEIASCYVFWDKVAKRTGTPADSGK